MTRRDPGQWATLILGGLCGLLALRKLPARSPRAVLWTPPPATVAPART